jgi:hypothetical protein
MNHPDTMLGYARADHKNGTSMLMGAIEADSRQAGSTSRRGKLGVQAPGVPCT